MEWYKGNLGLPIWRQICTEICRRRGEPLPRELWNRLPPSIPPVPDSLVLRCKWISSFGIGPNWLGVGWKASGWLNNSFWRAKTHGAGSRG